MQLCVVCWLLTRRLLPLQQQLLLLRARLLVAAWRVGGERVASAPPRREHLVWNGAAAVPKTAPSLGNKEKEEEEEEAIQYV
jgi:hypothetical protein